MPTPHNAALEDQIAPVVLMPGDPLRAKYVAENYLSDCICFNTVRNMLGYTGTYDGVRVSVMGSGMGIPSICIYSWELYHLYGVETIIRIGSAGGIGPDVKLRDLVIGQAACTDSNIASQYDLPGTIAPIASFDLIQKAVLAAEGMDVPYHVGNLLSSDVFYCPPDAHGKWASMGVLAVEMEAAGLYLNALAAGKKALSIMTISDLPIIGESLSAEQRQTSFTQMMEVALSVAASE